MENHKGRNLIVVRAGAKSIHSKWLASESERNWDLVVSWYDSAPYQRLNNEKIVHIKGGKWDGLYNTFHALPDLLSDYDYIWLPDDDIDTDQANLNRFFELASSKAFSVCQPALTWNSYFSHLITMRAPRCSIRYTNFAEIMAPCFRADFLRQCLPHFKDSHSGFGLDSIFFTLLKNEIGTVGVIDETPVFHTRPIGQFLAKKMEESGRNPKLEMAQTLASVGMSHVPTPFSFYYDLDGSEHPFRLFKAICVLAQQLVLVRQSPMPRHAIDLIFRELWLELGYSIKCERKDRQKKKAIRKL